MDTNYISIMIGLLGLLATCCGLLVAGIQTYRIRKLKKEENADVWLTIKSVKSIFYCINESRLKSENTYIARVFEASQNIFKTQLKRAVLNEKGYSIETINKWKATKKITTEWEEKQALNFLETKEISRDNNPDQSA